MGTNVEELLVAPQPNSLQTAAFNAIRAFAGEHAVIVSPKEGTHSGALLFDDATFTDTKSIITFYSDSNTGTDINLAILEAREGILSVTHSVEGVGYGVDSVEFCKLQKGKETSLVVSYTGVTTNEKYLTVYSFEEDVLLPLFVQDYSDFMVADIHGSGEEELIFALPSTREGALNLRIISLSDNTPTQLYLGTPNSEILEAISLKKSLSQGESLIVLEGFDVQNRLTGDLLRFEDSKVTSLLNSDERSLITHDNRLLSSLDIDGDNIIEQPGIYESQLEIPNDYILIGYYDMANNAQQPKYVGIVNTRLAFFVNIPFHWIENIEFMENSDGITAVNTKKIEPYFTLTLSEFSDPPVVEDAETEDLLQFGNDRLYLTTYGSLTEYEKKYLTEGITTIY